MPQQRQPSCFMTVPRGQSGWDGLREPAPEQSDVLDFHVAARGTASSPSHSTVCWSCPQVHWLTCDQTIIRYFTYWDPTLRVKTAARVWNSLPLETRACSSLLTFQRETKSHLFRQSYGWCGAVYSDGQQTSALSCATVLYLDFCRVPPQLCDGSTLIHDICSSSSKTKDRRQTETDRHTGRQADRQTLLSLVPWWLISVDLR